MDLVDARVKFAELPWHKKIHEDIEIEEVEGTLKMLEDLYKSIELNRGL